MAAIEEAVPADVLSAALYARFRSRAQQPLREKLLSAMRKGFGGHVEPKNGTIPDGPCAAEPCRRRRRPPVLLRRLWRGRRSDAAAAGPGAVQSGGHGIAAGAFRHRRRRAPRAIGASVSPRRYSPALRQIRDARDRATDRRAPRSPTLGYVDGELDDPATYRRLREALEAYERSLRRRQSPLLSRDRRRRPSPRSSEASRRARSSPSRRTTPPRHHRKAVRHDLASAQALNRELLKGLCASSRSTGSIIISARRRSRTSW